VCETTVDGEGRVHGHKHFVDYAQSATHHLVRAVGPDGPVLALVDARAPGVEMKPILHVGRTPAARVAYEGVPCEVVASGVEPVAALLRLGRALAAVQVVGAMEQSLDGAVEYAKVREQFGKPIGSFQAVRHHCANMASRIASGRWLAFEALSQIDAGRASDRIVAAAKASVSRAAPEVTMLAHQIFGGNGVIEENDHYFFTLRARERASAWGTVDECLSVLAADVRADNDWL
jgi:alkylation response protein AidB-like acyl-CoA dehydrogenase